jgi:misacylated tRNA(Ala) deacylase
MPTECLFRDDSYLKECTARVIAISYAGIMLNRTVFYASSGGHPGDSGILDGGSGAEIPG